MNKAIMEARRQERMMVLDVMEKAIRELEQKRPERWTPAQMDTLEEFREVLLTMYRHNPLDQTSEQETDNWRQERERERWSYDAARAAQAAWQILKGGGGFQSHINFDHDPGPNFFGPFHHTNPFQQRQRDFNDARTGKDRKVDASADKECWKVLGIGATANVKKIREAYRTMAKKKHPDSGGNHDEMIELNNAMKEVTEIVGGV